MSHQIALSFEDGVTRFIKCSPDETVADASYRARINIPLDCRDGACGTCKSLCESGTFDGGDYIDEALTEDEAAAGFALPCQMRPLSDLVLQIPTTSDVAKTEAGTHASTITEIRRHSGTTFRFTLKLADRDALAFLPGQYVNIAVPGTEVARSYSFSSGPADQDVSFLIRITDQGAMSSYLRDTARVGDQLDFTGPMGSFFLREPKRPALLLAGGTGLAPLLSILERLTTVELEHPVHLVYGVSTDTDLVELDKLEHYASVIDRFTFDYCVADQASSAPNKGYVTGLIGPEHVNEGDVDVYLCGPPAMVEAVRQWLKTEDITPTNFYYEKFALAVPAAAEPAAEPAAAEPAEAAASGTYEIGEEHLSLADSDAQFDARMALELGAVELTMGRLTPEQLTEYRILAELSSATISADRFLDAAAFTDTNAAFHEYLFNCTGNEFLLQAYQRLDVKSYMTRVLRSGQWVDESVPSDHLELVQAFERKDLSAARNIVVSHSARAKATMRSSIEASHEG
ncbi:benzoate 1,2-dioxygenase electron transfer component BenC [Arthrobacter sp. UYCu723]